MILLVVVGVDDFWFWFAVMVFMDEFVVVAFYGFCWMIGCYDFWFWFAVMVFMDEFVVVGVDEFYG